MNPFGFDKYTAKYLVAVKDVGGSAAITVTLPWKLSQFTADLMRYSSRAIISVYPFIGAVQAAHLIDLFGRNSLTQVGTITHNSNGVTGDGTSGILYIGGSKLPASIFPNLNDFSFGAYSRTNTTSDTQAEMGCFFGSRMYFAARTVAGNVVGYAANNTLIQVAVANSQGLFQVSRTSSSNAGIVKNGVLVGSSVVAPTTFPGISMTICAAVGQAYSARNLAFAYLGTGSGVTSYPDFYTTVQNFQIFLARQV